MSRRNLAPHLAWPVTPADLRAALGEDFSRVRVVKTDWKKAASLEPLTVSWVPTDVDDYGVGLSIWLRPVDRADRETIRDALLAEAVPDLVAWVRQAVAASQTWQGIRHERRWIFSGGRLNVRDDDGLHIIDRERGGLQRYRGDRRFPAGPPLA